MSTDIRKSLKEKVGRAPTGPGCYLWKADDDEILYVGKAVNLRARMRNYLAKQHDHVRTVLLMNRAADAEWIAVQTEKEALILEANLVKKYKPRFNVRLKDDKRYPYICVSLGEPFPQVFLTRTVRNDGGAYFGPFTDVRAARNTLALIHKIFPIRKVRQKLPAAKPKRPCMNFHIKRCLAPCTGEVPEDEYRKIVDEVLLFLEGKSEALESIVRKRMQEYSEALEFEKAGIYRDVLINIRRTSERQSVVQAGGDQDLLAVARRDDHGQIVLFEIRGGRLLDRKSFPLQGVEGAEDSELIESFVRDYYLEKSALPARIVAAQSFRGARTMEETLSERAERKIRIRAARSPENKALLNTAGRNAELLLSERLLATKLRDRESALEELQEMLSLPEPPAVIECYDISHFQGASTTASGVLFVDGHPRTSGYRQYKIKSVQGIHDPASIREVVARRIQRLQNEDRPMPDLIVIDGGATQLAAACEAAAALGAEDLAMIGLAKEREEIYFPGEAIPRQFDPNSPAMRLLRHARDEAHRFAVSRHRQSRNKATLRHLLDEVPDIGAARRKALLQHFTDRKIEDADAEELQEVPGIGRAIAQKIVDFFEARRPKEEEAEENVRSSDEAQSEALNDPNPANEQAV